MYTQYKELEALFSHTMFPDKNLQKELALKLNLPESTIKVCLIPLGVLGTSIQTMLCYSAWKFSP